jgi:tRNA dimethylallyltransferase
MSLKAPLIVILGPTAVGKTGIAIQVAENFNGEIVSADSRLLYRGMDIGTAKPTEMDRRKVPHHLIDVAAPDEEWSLAKFASSAKEIIHEIHQRGNIPFLVGGTGQYIRAIVEGWLPPPRAKDNSFREEMQKLAEKKGEEALHQELARIDPDSANKIHPANLRRIIRTLEIHHITGVPASQQRKKEPPHYEVLQVGLSLPRAILYKRIDKRIDAMMAEGFVEEVERLLSDGCSLASPAMSAIGYKQIGLALTGENSIEDAIQEMRKLTRQFVRRQANWFKVDDPSIIWITVDDRVVAAVSQKVRSFLVGNP